MKKSLLLLSLAALFAAPTAVFANGEWSNELYVNNNNTMGVEDPNGPGADNVDGDLTGAGTWVENIENNEISNGIVVGYEVRLINGVPREIPIYAVREEGTNKADRAQDPAAKPAVEAPKAEDKKEEAKPAAKDVKAAATKTAAKALPKTSAAK